MNTARTGRHTITGGNPAVNLGALIAAEADFRAMSRTFRSIRFSVPEDGGGGMSVWLSSSSTAAPAQAVSSNIIAISDFREYEQVNADLVWLYADVTTVLEWAGNPA